MDAVVWYKGREEEEGVNNERDLESIMKLSVTDLNS